MCTERPLHLSVLPSRDPSSALCVKTGGDRPCFDLPECVKCGCDRPTWRPPLDLTVTAVSALKIRNFSRGQQTDRVTTRRRYDGPIASSPLRSPSEPPCGGVPRTSVGQAQAVRMWRRRKAASPVRNLASIAVTILFDRYTECAECGGDRPTSDPPECVNRAGDQPTHRPEWATRVATW